MEKMIDLADTLISDIFKDAHGFRPRHYPRYMPQHEYEAEIARLEALVIEGIEEERASELRCQRIYEERIAAYQAQYGIDRYTAIRWESEAEGDDIDYAARDFTSWIWDRGMSYDLTDTYRAELRAAGIF